MLTIFRVKLFFAALFISTGIYAQQMVSGSITDEEGTPLPGASVIIQGTDQGVTTDFDGNYSISIDRGQTLEASFIGYKTATSVVGEQNQINLSLSSDNELDEVVIIGYGAIRKKDLTGTLDVVGSEDFTKGSVVSAQQLIQGKVAGVSIVSNSGAPGDGANVLIRGIGSLNLNSNPLFVVDGIPLDSGGVGGSRNTLNVINPNDIASMSVLKDASATAIYGSRAANGVILITTKKGKMGDVSYEFSSRATSFSPISRIDVLNASEFTQAVQATQDADIIARLGTSDTDWQKEIYDQAIGINSTFSASGALKGIPFRASLGHTDQEGILMGDKFNRTTASLNISPQFLDGDLRVNFNTRYVYTENDFANRGAIGSAAYFDPTKPVFDANSPFANYYTWLDADGTKLALSPTNPLALLNLTEDTSEVNRIISNVKIDYDLPVEGLTATINAGIDNSTRKGINTQDANLPTDADGFNGSNNEYNNTSTNLLVDAYVNYSKTLDASNFSITAGHSYQSFEYDNSSSQAIEYLNGDGSVNSDTSITQNFVDKSKNVLLSYFGRINYSVSEKYLITATLRTDASSKLPSNDRWGTFFSTALAWNIHKESPVIETVFNELKLRVGFGEVGNVNGLGDYNFLTRYTRSDIQSQYGFGTNFYTTFRPAPINKDLRWEVGQTYNAGLDFSFAQLGLSGSVNAYIKNTNDLIATSIVDPFTNFGTTINANIGDMENKGVELELNYTIVDTADFSFDVNYNVAINDNTITRLENEQNVGDLGFGNSLQRHQEGKAPYAYYVYKQIYGEDGRPIEGAYADLNGDGQINNDDRYFYKDPYADILMGLTTSMRYKQFDLTIVSRASFGNYSYNSMSASSNQSQITNLNRLSNVHSDYLDTGFLFFSDKNAVSDHYIQNASFFRIDNITLGYTIENVVGENPLRLYVTGDNLFVETEYNGIDPEITGGIDNNFYPRSRALALGLDIKF
ncbi:MAG: SusC/RagA family TonB-linked outer membrane protein [Flavobacteriaceae bacterium]|nr:SusC/RagA family TonB-linked outer membrane protein [Flavobacteriaceae bacterium]